MKAQKILEITRVKYTGYVYNLELASDSEDDDLYWVDQETCIVTHNCLPKDSHALAHKSEQKGYDPLMLKAALELNDRVRKNKDWLSIKGAVSSCGFE